MMRWVESGAALLRRLFIDERGALGPGERCCFCDKQATMHGMNGPVCQEHWGQEQW